MTVDAFPLNAVLFWIAVTLAPPDTSQILVNGPDLHGAWTRQVGGWSYSYDRSLSQVKGTAVAKPVIGVKGMEGKEVRHSVEPYVKGVKENDWQKVPTLTLEPPTNSLTKKGESFVYTVDQGTANEKQYVIQFRRKSASSTGILSPTSANESANESPSTPQVSQRGFGPVIERVVEGAVSGKAAIDFDTGELFIGPQVVKRFKDLDDWMKAKGVDALGMLGPEIRGLGGFDMIALAVANDRWDISVAKLKEVLTMGKPGTAQMIGKGDLPATYVFKTREGGMGVLQIVGFTKKPEAVKIRYKLVEEKAEKTPASKEKSNIAQLKLDSAKKIFEIVEGRYEEGATTGEEFLKAKLDLDVAEAELKGDAVAAARAKLHYSEELVQYIEKRVQAGFGKTQLELEKAKLALEVAAAELENIQGSQTAKTQTAKPAENAKPDMPEPEPPHLLYEIDPSSPPTDGQKPSIDWLVGAIDRRINSGPKKVARVQKMEENRIRVSLLSFDDEDLQRVERLLARPGTLEFRILASDQKNKDLIEQAMKEPSKSEVLDPAGKRLAWWVPVKADLEKGRSSYSDIAKRTTKKENRDVMEILVVPDSYNVTGKYLTQAKAGVDHSGQPCLRFTFNSEGGKLFGEFTGSHKKDEQTGYAYKLGIIVDGELHSAPSINSTIYDQGEITGHFTEKEVAELADALNSGALPVKLRLVAEAIGSSYPSAEEKK